jgi:hypothetical protein
MPLTPESNFSNLGVNSLDMVEIQLCMKQLIFGSGARKPHAQWRKSSLVVEESRMIGVWRIEVLEDGSYTEWIFKNNDGPCASLGFHARLLLSNTLSEHCICTLPLKH